MVKTLHVSQSMLTGSSLPALAADEAETLNPRRRVRPGVVSDRSFSSKRDKMARKRKFKKHFERTLQLQPPYVNKKDCRLGSAIPTDCTDRNCSAGHATFIGAGTQNIDPEFNCCPNFKRSHSDAVGRFAEYARNAVDGAVRNYSQEKESLITTKGSKSSSVSGPL